MSANTVDNRFMEFKVGDQLYALNLLSVKEVIQKPEVTEVPNMPSHFAGMINLRGQILGIYNVRKKLSTKAKAAAADNATEVVIVVEQGGVSVGMLVDEVTRVLHAQADKIGPAPLKEGDPASAYIAAVIQTEEGLVQAVNLNQLLELDKYKSRLVAA